MITDCMQVLFKFTLGVTEQTLDNPDDSGYTLLLPVKRLDISAIIKAKSLSTEAISQGHWKPADVSKRKVLET